MKIFYRLRHILPVFYLWMFCNSGTTNLIAQQHFNVVHPKPADKITARDSTFVFGNYSSPVTQVRVNGNQAILFPNQTFLAMIPVSPGSLAIDTRFYTSNGIVTDSRTVFVPSFLFPSPADTIMFDPTFTYPDRNVSIQPATRIAMIVKGSPNCNVYCSFGEDYMFKLKEINRKRRYRWRDVQFGFDNPWALPRIRGIYVGYFTANEADTGKVFAPFFTMIARNEQVKTMRASGSVHIRKKTDPIIKTLLQDMTIFNNTRSRTYLTVLKKNTLVDEISGYGDYNQISLDEKQKLWVKRSKLRTAIENLSTETRTNARLQISRAGSDSNSISTSFLLDRTVPFQIYQSTNLKSFILKFWNVQKTPSMIRNDHVDLLFNKISGKMVDKNTYQFNLNFTHKMVWGFNIKTENNTVIAKFNKSPVTRFDRSAPLRGIKICLDPGHGPDDGAFGLTGVTEKMITLQYAQLLRELLENRGAKVFLTREHDTGPSLQQRTLFAAANDADLYVSLHFNALPNGVNPLKVRGTSTYYYHPHSKPLALAIHRRMLKKTRLPDKGVHLQNLAVCRITSMPAVLLEPAFIMQPYEETRILNLEFRQAVCEGIRDGIEDFIAKYH